MGQFNADQQIPLFENFCRKNQVDGKVITAEVAGKPLDLKVASTPRSQDKGYMGATAEPKDGEGILFVYDGEQPLSFWMKDVPFALDIIFFDSNMDYLGHETMQPHNGEPDHEIPQYFSKKPARFAVEVKSGWCKTHLTPDCKLSI
jgi:hypothetical protein